jgi:formylmethanofuran dehydrogenase subunit C
MDGNGGWKRARRPLINGDAPLSIGTLMVGGMAPLVNGDNGGWTGTAQVGFLERRCRHCLPNAAIQAE